MARAWFALSVILMTALFLCLVGCTEKPQGGTATSGKSTGSGSTKGDTTGGGSAKGEQGSGTGAQGGLVAFVRSADIVVRDLATGKETALTSDGTPDGDRAYACPTFTDAKTVMFLKADTTTNAPGWEVRRATMGQGTSTAAQIEPALGLGYSAKSDRVLYLKLTGKAAEPGELFGADISLVARSESRGTHLTKIQTWYGDVSPSLCRIRMSPEETLVSVPRFPTDVSDDFALVGWDSEQEVPVLKDEWLGAIIATGIAFGGTSVYATFQDATHGNGTPPLTEGLYRLDVKSLQHQRVSAVESPEGLAVSEALGVAVTSEKGTLVTIDLGTGAKREIGEGDDPDVFPR